MAGDRWLRRPCQRSPAMIGLPCPGCGNALPVAQDQLPSQVLCPDCARLVTVPAPATVFAPSQPARDSSHAEGVPGYEIEAELGRGGTGVVYRARQVHLKRLVALKMILAGSHAAAEERTRFL